MNQVLRRAIAALAVFPTFAVCVVLIGILSGAIGTGVALILKYQNGLGGRSLRGVLAVALILVASVGFLQILKWLLRIWNLIPSRAPRVMQALEDSVLIVAALGVVAGLGILGLTIGGVFSFSVPAVGTGVFLLTSSLALAIPRIRRPKYPLPPHGPKFPGARSEDIPRQLSSTEARANVAAR